jgi:hypothetical protein
MEVQLSRYRRDGHARPRKAHRQPEDRHVPPRETRRSLRDRAGRSINQKRAGKTIRPKERPKGENVVDLMEALRQSVGREAAPAKAAKPAKKPRKGAAGQKEMLMSIQGKKRLRKRRRRNPRRASGGSRLRRLTSGAPAMLQEDANFLVRPQRPNAR